ncbi:hypothetical protein PLESTB_001366300 [Pleodorina starrii]|uniref:Uncharacterized protein n=1 Tax=Pleodorina starrii TaxID=330485 RepID=A0A9W6F7F8_9CHLO|nr:hypothetical protein PLESTM_000418700 [Pleodorina starrii]GLC58486.1 hypothetical protein PLESTB_001366300 [Pleodorina starrii]GLC74144.1 hypothetical protein PLESTF_001466500 [Pleodorina starrii]
MLPMQSAMRPGLCREAIPKALKPTVSRATLPTPHRLDTRIVAPDTRVRAYDDYDGTGRAGRPSRGRDQRKQRGGRSRSSEDEEDWDQATLLDDGDVSSEEININGTTVTASSVGEGYGYPTNQESGRSYGRGGGGGGGYERRGGGGGGRGYGRGYGGGDRRGGGSYGYDQQQQQQQQGGGGEGGRDFGQQGGQGQWQGRREGGRGYGGQGQGRRGGGRGRGGYGGFGGEGGVSAAGAGAGEERRTFRGPREALSPEALAARHANNDAVRSAADWRGVAALLESRGNSLDAENIAAMLVKVAREGRPSSPADTAEFETLVASLYGWVSALCPVLRPKQLATCLYAIARLELFNAELVASLAARAQQFMGNFNSYEYSNMVWAFARMNYTPGDEWLQQFVYWTEKRLGGFKPVELSNTVGALSRLGHMPGPNWLAAFTESVARQASDFNNLEAVNTLFGLASLGYNGGSDPGSWLGPLLSGGSTAGSSGEGGSSSASPSSGAAPSGANVASMRVADLTRTTWALTQFDWRPPEWWLEGATRGFVAQLRYCLPSDLATISYSLAYLRARPSPDGLQMLATNLARVWPKLTGDELANCAMSLALWQYRPPSDRWMDELVLACREKLPSCSADALSKVVSALPLLGQGYRLNQVVAQAQAMLDASNQQQQQQEVEGGQGDDLSASPDAALASV